MKKAAFPLMYQANPFEKGEPVLKIDDNTSEELHDAREDHIRKAIRSRLPEEYVLEPENLIDKLQDIFRVCLDDVPPAR
jgi:hypothetical protein